MPLARYVKLRLTHAPGLPGTFSPPPRVSDPDMHHGRCVTHVPWCMPGSLTSDLLWRRWRGKRSRYSRCMPNRQFYVTGKNVKISIRENIDFHIPWYSLCYEIIAMYGFKSLSDNKPPLKFYTNSESIQKKTQNMHFIGFELWRHKPYYVGSQYQVESKAKHVIKVRCIDNGLKTQLNNLSRTQTLFTHTELFWNLLLHNGSRIPRKEPDWCSHE